MQVGSACEEKAFVSGSFDLSVSSLCGNFIVEVKWSSGKSLLGAKATLESVIGSRGLSKVAISKAPGTGLGKQAPFGESFFKNN